MVLGRTDTTRGWFVLQPCGSAVTRLSWTVSKIYSGPKLLPAIWRLVYVSKPDSMYYSQSHRDSPRQNAPERDLPEWGHIEQEAHSHIDARMAEATFLCMLVKPSPQLCLGV